jgi:hypothetical protein
VILVGGEAPEPRPALDPSGSVAQR